jgi:hypothetical protein
MAETSLLWAPKMNYSGYVTQESLDAVKAGVGSYSTILQGVSDIPANQLTISNVWDHAWLIDANSEINPKLGIADDWGPNPAFPTPKPSWGPGTLGMIYPQNPMPASPFINWGWNYPNSIDFSINSVTAPPSNPTNVHNGLFLSQPLWSGVDPLATQTYIRGEVTVMGYSLSTPTSGFRIPFAVEFSDATGYVWFMEMQILCDRFNFESANGPYTRAVDYGSGTALFWAPNEMVPTPNATAPTEYQFDVTDLIKRAKWPGKKPVSPLTLNGCYTGGEITGSVWAWWRVSNFDLVTGNY